MDDRNGLAVAGRLTLATSRSEREAALEMADDLPGQGRATLGADRAYDVRGFIETLRVLKITPHIAAKVKFGAIDARTTRHRGLRRVGWMSLFTLAAHNLVQMRNLSPRPVSGRPSLASQGDFSPAC